MTPWPSMLQALVNQTIQRSDHLRERLEELRSKRFTSSQAPLFLIRLLLNLNEEICKNLTNVTKMDFASINYSRYVDAQNKIQAYAGVLAQLYVYVAYIEASHVEVNPPGIISAIERVARILLPDEMILICPSYACNYQYINILSENNLRSKSYVPRLFPESVFKKREIFAVLLYPYILKNDTLCHILLIHEVAHVIDELKRICAKVLDIRPPDTPPEISNERLMLSFSEYAADIMAVCILGPSFIFALIEFHTSVAGPADLTTSPPLFLRILNILVTLTTYKQRFTNFVKHRAAKHTEDFLNTLGRYVHPSRKDIPIHKDSVKIFKCLEPSLSKVRSQIKDLIPFTLQFRPTHELFEVYIDNWVERGIPPSAVQEEGEPKPITLGELINAVWIYRLIYLQKPIQVPFPLRQPNVSKQTKQDVQVSKLFDLSRLAQLAIRQNEALRLYEEAKL